MKGLSKKIKVKLKKRKINWTFIFAFFIGAAFAEFTADPISDYLFFLRSEKGAFSPIESVVYWYYLPGVIHIIFLGLAVLFYKLKLVKAKEFMFAFLLLITISTFLTFKIFNYQPIEIALLLIPYILLVASIFYEEEVK